MYIPRTGGGCPTRNPRHGSVKAPKWPLTCGFTEDVTLVTFFVLAVTE